LKRFILDKELDKDNNVRLEGSDYRYLVRVRRLAPGEFFPALLPNGEETLVQVLSIDHGVLTGKCNSPEKENKTENVPPIILFQALPKGDKMDLIVRQAAEGGLAEIVPFVSEFSIKKIKAGGQPKLLRWERIIKEARQQSGSPAATAVHSPLTIDGLFAHWEEIRKNTPGALGIIFHHLPLAQKSLHSYLEKIPQAVVIAIGPEGGFSGPEASRFMEAGFVPLTIGNTILRTETAALYCAAAIRVILLERDSWEMKQA
jgi:16S rRNA (uracil1498-N3)-methyltransferase